MARGKIQIKRIENDTNRQVTYSKRRNGLFRKAGELTVLCDAKISILMFSSTSKLHEFISPSISAKQMFDQYQKTVGVDLWSSQYERMQEHLKKLKDVNRSLRTEIRQRMGDCLNELCYEQLVGLEQDMDSSLQRIRDRKFKVLGNQIETHRKKLRNVEQIHRNLLQEFDVREEDVQVDCGVVENMNGEYVGGGFHGYGGRTSPRIFAVRVPPSDNHIMRGSNHLQLSNNGVGVVGSDLTTYALL
ncbi:floral homeotic protein DEFICIENS-like [Impatiens glandulifera]|nr:floral homeotic protein DEFICIENS-like [Impatiens glandulifera]